MPEKPSPYIYGVGATGVAATHGGNTMSMIATACRNPQTPTPNWDERRGPDPNSEHWFIATDQRETVPKDMRRLKNSLSETLSQVMVFDFDKGDLDLAQVNHAVDLCVGVGVHRIIHSTRSSMKRKLDGSIGRRWRAFVETPVAIDRKYLPSVGLAFKEVLAEHGIELDKSTWEITQPTFLPFNNGLHYEYHFLGDRPLTAQDMGQHPATRLAAAKVKEFMLTSDKRYSGEGKSVDTLTPIGAIVAAYDIEPYLHIAGYTESAYKPGNWQSLFQTSGTYATKVTFDGCAITLSGSDREAGFCSRNGALDVFDVMVLIEAQRMSQEHNSKVNPSDYMNMRSPETFRGEAFKFVQGMGIGLRNIGGNRAVLDYAKEYFTDEVMEGIYKHLREQAEEEYREKVSVNAANSGMLESPVIALRAVEAQVLEAQQVLESLPDPQPHQVPEVTPPPVASTSKYSNLPMPSGFLGELATYLYEKRMTQPLWDIAIVAAWMIAAALQGRKDNMYGLSGGIMVTLLGINGVGKDLIRDSLNFLLDVIREQLVIANPTGFQHDPMYLFCDLMKPSSTTFGVTQTVKRMGQRPSMLIINSEAGVAGDSTAGDTASLRAGIMQYVVQGAYSTGNFKAANELKRQPIGTQLSVLVESTEDAFIKHMDEGQVKAGDVARTLFVNIDVSKQLPGTSRIAKDYGTPPTNILDGVWRLLAEAMREAAYENGEAGMKLKDENDDWVEVGFTPVNPLQKVTYKPEPQVEAALAKLAQEEENLRRGNTDNDPSMEWAQKIRYKQILQKLILLAARTDNVASAKMGEARHKATVQHYNDAKALLDECNRVALANSANFANDEDLLEEEMVLAAVKLLNKPVSKTLINFATDAQGERILNMTQRTIRATECHEKLMIPLLYFYNGKARKCSRVVERLRSVPIRKPSSRAFYDAAVESGKDRLWFVSPCGKYLQFPEKLQ